MSAAPARPGATERPVSARTLALAVERDVITPAQLEALRLIERDLSPGQGPVQTTAGPSRDDEQLRFVSGFADIFVTIGILLFIGALFAIMGATGSTPALAGIAAASWLLAEFFTGKRRMALPSIVLLVLFVGATLILSLQVFAQLLPAARALPDRFWFVPDANAPALALAAITTAALAAMHYLRFRVPITVAAGTAALCLLALGMVAAAKPDLNDADVNVVLLVCGLAVFALAMHFDMSDPDRLTRRTDIAFWLHLLAAPLIVHPLIQGLLHGLGQTVGPGVIYGNTQGLTLGPAIGILWIFLILGIVALVVDRRAILVSSLIYAGTAFGTVVRTLGQSSLVLPTVLLVLGAFILLISAGWQPLRRAILRRLPQPLARRLPNPLLASAS